MVLHVYSYRERYPSVRAIDSVREAFYRKYAHFVGRSDRGGIPEGIFLVHNGDH